MDSLCTACCQIEPVASMVHRVWTSEWIACGYFIVLVVACWVRPVKTTRRAIITVASFVAVVTIVYLSSIDLPSIHMWAPLAYIGVGYYLCGLLWVAPSGAMETWLKDWDRRLLGADPSRSFAKWPTPVLSAFSVIYASTFLVVPAGLAVLLLGGHSALADRFWTLVLGAEFGSFAALAIVQTRPPWTFAPMQADRASVHGFVARLVERYLIGANTFPSGHVASTVAVAVAVMGAMPWTGVAFLSLAACIAIATVVGRYHYVMDAAAGALLAIAVWVIVSVAG